MNRRQLLIIMTLALAVVALIWAVDLANAGPGLGIFADGAPGNPTFYANSPAGNCGRGVQRTTPPLRMPPLPQAAVVQSVYC